MGIFLCADEYIYDWGRRLGLVYVMGSAWVFMCREGSGLLVGAVVERGVA